jgi:hypothetical protein
MNLDEFLALHKQRQELEGSIGPECIRREEAFQEDIKLGYYQAFGNVKKKTTHLARWTALPEDTREEILQRHQEAGRAAIAGIREQIADIDARLAAAARYIDIPASEEWSLVDTSSASYYSTQTSPEYYARADAESKAKDYESRGVAVRVERCPEHAYAELRIIAQTTPAGVILLKYKPSQPFRERVRGWLKSGANISVMTNGLLGNPLDICERLGLTLRGDDVPGYNA